MYMCTICVLQFFHLLSVALSTIISARKAQVHFNIYKWNRIKEFHYLDGLNASQIVFLLIVFSLRHFTRLLNYVFRELISCSCRQVDSYVFACSGLTPYILYKKPSAADNYKFPR